MRYSSRTYLLSYARAYLVPAAKFCNIRVAQLTTDFKDINGLWETVEACKIQQDGSSQRVPRCKGGSWELWGCWSHVRATRNASHNEMEQAGI